MSIGKWMDKEDLVYIHNGILLSHKKEWNNVICNNRDGPRDYHTKWSKSERQIPYYITYMWNLKWHKWTYLQNKNRLTEVKNKLTDTKRKGDRGRMN